MVGEAVEVLATELKAGDLRAAIEVLKAVGLYGKVEPPADDTDPDVILVKQAKLWAQQEIAKEPPSADPLKDFLDKDEYTNDEASYGENCPVSAKTTGRT